LIAFADYLGRLTLRSDTSPLPCRDDFAERSSRFDGTLIDGTPIDGTLKIDYPMTVFPQRLLFWLRCSVINARKSPQDLVQTRTVLVPFFPPKPGQSLFPLRCTMTAIDVCEKSKTGTVLLPPCAQTGTVLVPFFPPKPGQSLFPLRCTMTAIANCEKSQTGTVLLPPGQTRTVLVPASDAQ